MKIDLKLNEKNRLFHVGAQIVAATREVARETVETIAESVRAHVPVDTGNLKGTIAAGPDGEDTNTWIVSEGGPTEASPDGADYALFVEFGTVKMPAQPHFVPAVEQEIPGFEAAVRAALERLPSR